MKVVSQKQMNWSYAWLVLGSILMYFSNWNWAFPPATWLFAVFLIRFSRTHKKSTGLLALFVVSSIVGVASMWKLLAIEAIPPSFRVVSGVAVGVIIFLPFMADRLLTRKMPGVVATLVFPLSWTALEYLKSLGSGSWGALAYTQYGNLPLMQLASITGIWGLSFLITWFAAIVNFAWEHQFARREIRKIAIVYVLIMFFVYSYGHGRLALSEESITKVCIASVTNPRDFVARFYAPDWTDRKSAYQSMQEDLDYLSGATERSADAGSGIVFWQEYAVSVMEENEKEFLDRVRKLAREEKIYLAVAIGLFPLNYPVQPWQNKLVWIDPNGEVIGEYHKLKPAPPLEPIVPGTGAIPILDTAFGKIASVICADLDYPSLLHHPGADRADILIIPAQDWAAVDPLHTHMAAFRAIENGFSLVKGTGGGLSSAVDPYGRIINSLEYPSTHGRMISCLPTKGVGTVYSRIGDSFAWLCILGFVMLVAVQFFPENPFRGRREG